MDAVIDHSVPRAKIVPVLPLREVVPPNITVDPSMKFGSRSYCRSWRWLQRRFKISFVLIA